MIKYFTSLITIAFLNLGGYLSSVNAADRSFLLPSFREFEEGVEALNHQHLPQNEFYLPPIRVLEERLFHGPQAPQDPQLLPQGNFPSPIQPTISPAPGVSSIQFMPPVPPSQQGKPHFLQQPFVSHVQRINPIENECTKLVKKCYENPTFKDLIGFTSLYNELNYGRHGKKFLTKEEWLMANNCTLGTPYLKIRDTIIKYVKQLDQFSQITISSFDRGSTNFLLQKIIELNCEKDFSKQLNIIPLETKGTQSFLLSELEGFLFYNLKKSYSKVDKNGITEKNIGRFPSTYVSGDHKKVNASPQSKRKHPKDEGSSNLTGNI